MSEEPKILYHYTSVATLLKILQGVEETGKLTLRGTHIEYLNDKAEYITAIELTLEALKEYNDSSKISIAENFNEDLLRRFTGFNTHPPFITSFSGQCDSLPMWTHYANKGQGVAIGLEPIDQWGDFEGDQELSWDYCLYKKEDIKTQAYFKGIIDHIFDHTLEKDGKILGMHGSLKDPPRLTEAAKFFSLIKHPAFEYEQEIRLIKQSYNKTSKLKGTVFEIKFRESDGLTIPYIEHHLPKNILKEIRIGPCSDFDLSKKSLEMRLHRAGYEIKKGKPVVQMIKPNTVEIIKSDIPYRLI